MGFNCAAEKAKFDREWAKLRKEYANAGMSEKSIQKIYEYDWHCFCRNRAYERRATKMPSIEIDGPDDDRRSALFRKSGVMSTTFDETGFQNRYRNGFRIKRLLPAKSHMAIGWLIVGYALLNQRQSLSA